MRNLALFTASALLLILLWLWGCKMHGPALIDNPYVSTSERDVGPELDQAR
jgi:hypothetical protein